MRSPVLIAASTLWFSLLAAAPASAEEPLCAQRAPCRVVETLEAGKDAKGQPLQVKHLSLGWLDSETASNAIGRKFVAKRKAEGSRERGECEATEWWLMRPGLPAQLLLSVCNDGYGAAGVGEDVVTVGEKLFTHQQSGGSADRWSSSRTLQLSPLALVGESLQSFRTDEPDKVRGSRWDVMELRGEAIVPPPSCEGAESVGGRTLPYLPLVQVEKSYLQGGWKQAGLGSCALTAGHWVLGKQEDPKDAGLKAVLAERETLLLEVRDNRWTGPSGTKWLADDHVELWLAPWPPQDLMGCGKPLPDQKAVQWGIRIADGQVFPAYGSPKQKLKVEKAEIRGPEGLEGYRLNVTLPKGFRSVSVSYSDSDEGKKQERMLATSPLKFPRPETLNAVRLVLPEEATCVVREGKLVVVPTELKSKGPDVAVLTSP